MQLEVLHEDGPCLVVNKPSGVLTQAPPGIDSMEVRVRQFYLQREGKEGNIYVGVPHRLDRPASGALVFARHVRATRRIADQFAARKVRKVYWAIVEGMLDAPAGTWVDQLRKLPGRARSEVVDADHPEGKQAVLHYRVRGMQDGMTWLEIELETGRTHQIRVQCATRGFPIWGDDQYGASQVFGEPFEDARERAIALHARSIEFQHPMSRDLVSVTAPAHGWWEG
ncbi:MAG: RNA pseudouridine synthase [Pirellulaceae bacterium]